MYRNTWGTVPRMLVDHIGSGKFGLHLCMPPYISMSNFHQKALIVPQRVPLSYLSISVSFISSHSPPPCFSAGLSISDIGIFIAVQIRTSSHYNLTRIMGGNRSERLETEMVGGRLGWRSFQTKESHHGCFKLIHDVWFDVRHRFVKLLSCTALPLC